MSLDKHLTNKTKSPWEWDMGVAFTEEWWDEAVDRLHSITSCACLGLTVYNSRFCIEFISPSPDCLKYIQMYITDVVDVITPPKSHVLHLSQTTK